MTETEHPAPSDDSSGAGAPTATDAVARVLASAESRARSVVVHGAAALQADAAYLDDRDGDQFDREERAALRRVRGLSTELEDVTEVE